MAAHRTRRVATVALVLVAVLLGACRDTKARSDSKAVERTASSLDEALTGPLSVVAAASFTEVFDALGTAFTERHPKVPVTFSFAGTPDVVKQVQAGGPVDVIAVADDLTIGDLVAKHVVGNPQTFARNRLELIVRPGNPKDIRNLADLTQPGVTVSLAAPDVPAGRYASQLLAKAGVHVTPAAPESNVKAVVAKVTLGEADAGIVYATDVRAAGTRVDGVTIPEDQNVVTSALVAQVDKAQHPGASRAFVDFVLSSEGRRILRQFGFLDP